MKKTLLVLFVLSIMVFGVFYYHSTQQQDSQTTGSGETQFRSFVERSSYGESVLSSTNMSLEEVMRSRPDYFGVGLYRKPEYPGGMFKSAVHRVNNSFSGYLLLANAKESDYTVFVLVDYVQVPFYLNGTLNLTHHVVLGNMQHVFLRFNITNITTGRHDVFIGVFRNPNSQDRGLHRVPGFRLQVVSGDPIVTLPNFTHPEVCTANNTQLDAFVLLTKEPCGDTIWEREELTSQEIKYYGVIGETKKNLQTFALVELLDFKQVPIGNGTKPLFGYLNRNELVNIPLFLKLSGSNTTHRLVLLYFTEPFEPLEYPPGIWNTNLRLISEQSNTVVIKG